MWVHLPPLASTHTKVGELCWNCATGGCEHRNSSRLKAPALCPQLGYKVLHPLPKELMELMGSSCRRKPRRHRCSAGGGCTTRGCGSSEIQEFQVFCWKPSTAKGKLLVCLSPPAQLFKGIYPSQNPVKSVMLQQISLRAGILRNFSPFIFGSDHPA